MYQEREYFKRLDYVRIISCIMVLLYHLNIAKGGFLAVCTFFVISGYLAGISALYKHNFSLKSYYISKLKRIYVPLILVVFFTIIICKITNKLNLINIKSETMSILFGYNNFWQLKANLDYFTKNVNSPFIHFWFISILMQFYLFFPLIYCALEKLDEKTNNSISCIILIISTIVSLSFFYYLSRTNDIMEVYYNTFSRLFSILFGTCIAFIHYKVNINIVPIIKKFNIPIFISYIVILVLICFFASSQSPFYAIYMIIVTLISVRLIEYSTIHNSSRRDPNFIIKKFSDITYEIYLVQYPIIFFIQDYMNGIILKIFLIFIFAFILHIILNYDFNNKAIIIFRFISLFIVVITGSIIVFTEKNYTSDMEELKTLLNENEKITENNNNILFDSNNNVLLENNNENETPINEEQAEIDYAQIDEIVRNLPIVGIGDSVLLGAYDGLHEKFPNGYFDGKVSRSIKGGKEVITELKNKGKLSNIIVLALANNGDYSTKKNDELMELIGEDAEIFWINAVNADDPEFNEKFKEYCKNHSNLHIIDWENISKGHQEYFYADGIHLKGDGIYAYADAVYDAIYNYYISIKR